MTVIVDELAINYQIEGSGPVVVLLHGWGDNLNGFNKLKADLKKKYTVVLVDLPGFGGSSAPDRPFSLDDYANFVANFIKKLDIKNVYCFVGHSNGGAIAIKGLSAGILVSKKLVLIASSGIRSSANPRSKALRFAAKTAKYPTKLLPKNTQKKLKKKVYAKIGSDLFVAEHMQETFKLVVSEDISNESAMISQKTLIIYGRDDTATPVVYGQTFHKQIENSKLNIIEGADHFVHQTNYLEVNKMVLEFIS